MKTLEWILPLSMVLLWMALGLQWLAFLGVFSLAWRRNGIRSERSFP